MYLFQFTIDCDVPDINKTKRGKPNEIKHERKQKKFATETSQRKLVNNLAGERLCKFNRRGETRGEKKKSVRDIFKGTPTLFDSSLSHFGETPFFVFKKKKTKV